MFPPINVTPISILPTLEKMITKILGFAIEIFSTNTNYFPLLQFAIRNI